MSRKDIYKDGVKTQFSKYNQPTTAQRKVPKYKTRLKKAIRDHFEKFEAQMSDGDKDFWRMAYEYAYGKPDQKIEANYKIDSAAVEKVENIFENKMNDK